MTEIPAELFEVELLIAEVEALMASRRLLTEVQALETYQDVL